MHVNSLDGARRVGAQTGGSIVDVLQRSVDAIRGVSGVPHINHPNFQWAFTTDELQQVKNNKLFEIFNGHPTVNNVGGGNVPGLEEVWDRLLSNGDPAVRHRGRRRAQFQAAGQPDGRRAGPRLGDGPRGAPRSEGVARIARARRLLRVHRRRARGHRRPAPAGMTVKVKPEGTSKYRIQFIGAGGRILSDVGDVSASYTFKGDEGYVRAKVIESNGRMAWCQPVMVPRKTPAN